MLVMCGTCDARVRMDVTGTAERQDAPEEGGTCYRATLGRCPECTNFLLVQEDGYFDGPEGELTWTHRRRLYPADETTLPPEVPIYVRNSFYEARTCFKNGTYVAAAIMCRRTLEAFCQHKQASGASLHAMIESLHVSGVIDDRLKDWASVLKNDGNLAVHDPTVEFREEDARDLIEFTETFIEYVFIIAEHFKAFEARHKARVANKQPKRKKAPPSAAAAPSEEQ